MAPFNFKYFLAITCIKTLFACKISNETCKCYFDIIYEQLQMECKPPLKRPYSTLLDFSELNIANKKNDLIMLSLENMFFTKIVQSRADNQSNSPAVAYLSRIYLYNTVFNSIKSSAFKSMNNLNEFKIYSNQLVQIELNTFTSVKKKL